MPHYYRRCITCGLQSVGQQCNACWQASRREPAPAPCPGCNSPLHRKSTPISERRPGSKYYGAHGHCTGCLKRAVKAGNAPAPKPKARSTVSTPQPRIVVKAALTNDEREKAGCREVGYDLYDWAADGDNTAQRDAKQICATCPIRLRCLEVALENNEQFGVFGGKTTSERARIRKARRLELAV